MAAAYRSLDFTETFLETFLAHRGAPSGDSSR
jgi:hypothetical protein